MELNYRYAIVSFCPDLLDAKTSSLPVALLMIAASGDDMVAAATGWYPEDAEDPMSSALLRDMPRFLKAHVDDLVKSKPDVDLESILCELQHSLRNSVHVSAVSAQLTEHVATAMPEDLSLTVTSKAVALFFKELRKAGLYLQPAKPALNGARKQGEFPTVTPLSVWPLTNRTSRVHRTEELMA